MCPRHFSSAVDLKQESDRNRVRQKYSQRAIKLTRPWCAASELLKRICQILKGVECGGRVMSPLPFYGYIFMWTRWELQNQPVLYLNDHQGSLACHLENAAAKRTAYRRSLAPNAIWMERNKLLRYNIKIWVRNDQERLECFRLPDTLNTDKYTPSTTEHRRFLGTKLIIRFSSVLFSCIVCHTSVKIR